MKTAISCRVKPYMQPFERKLALRELEVLAHDVPWPLPAGDDSHGQPIHVHRKVVNLPQKRIGRNCAGAQHREQMFTLRFNQDAVADQVECLVLGGGFPAHLCRAGFDGDDFIQHVLPGACGNQRIAVAEIDAGQTQIHGGLVAGLIHRHEQPIGLCLVLGLEAGEGFGGVVKGVVNAFAA